MFTCKVHYLITLFGHIFYSTADMSHKGHWSKNALGMDGYFSKPGFVCVWSIFIKEDKYEIGFSLNYMTQHN